MAAGEVMTEMTTTGPTTGLTLQLTNSRAVDVTANAPEPRELLDVAPGERRLIRVPVFQRASGEVMSLSFHVLRGRRPGPRLGLVATVCGDAAWGARVLRETLSRVDLAELRGTIVALPLANPIAFESFTHSLGQGMNTEYGNLNQTFPGNVDGWMTEKMSAAITRYFVDNVDVVVYEGSAADIAIHYTLVNADVSADASEADRTSIALARLLGTEFVFVNSRSSYPKPITEFSRRQGKIVIAAEMGGTGELPADYLATCLRSHDNLLKGLDMLDGEPDLPDRQLILRPPLEISRVMHGGLFEPVLGPEALGTVLRGRQVLGRVIDPHTFDELQVFEAPDRASAVMLARTRFTRVNPGDFAYILGDAESGEEVEPPRQRKVRLP